LPEKVLDVAWVMPDHVGVNVLPWQQYACGLLQHYSADSDAAFDDADIEGRG
jgi:hypothetical protein